jgi:translation initiation factor 3 subunit L
LRAQEAYRLQLRCFLGLVQEQRHLPSLKQLLKLYTTISLPKLASLMDLDEPTLRSQLILLKVPPLPLHICYVDLKIMLLYRCF